MKTLYEVMIDDKKIVETDNLELAIRQWDSVSYSTIITNGFISVMTWNDNGDMVRDGNILHIRNGHVYLNPRILGEC